MESDSRILDSFKWLLIKWSTFPVLSATIMRLCETKKALENFIVMRNAFSLGYADRINLKPDVRPEPGTGITVLDGQDAAFDVDENADQGIMVRFRCISA